MSSSSSSNAKDAFLQADVRRVLLDQKDSMRSKRAVIIKLAHYPSNTSLSFIMKVLKEILLESNLFLERLLLAENKMERLPEEILHVCDDHLRILDLHGNDLQDFPAVICSALPKLEFLDLSSNRLWCLPPQVSTLADLRVLNLSNNLFSYLPPALGELISLERLVVSANPLVLPSPQTFQTLEKDANRLKAYLLSNSIILEQSISQQSHKLNTTSPSGSRSRSRSISETKSKSSKASRRMGLIINKSKTPGVKTEVFPKSEEASDFSEAPPTLSGSEAQDAQQQLKLTSPSRTRLRQNTMIEINDMLQQPELNDAEYKSGAYFRRLSTLQEVPIGGDRRDVPKSDRGLESAKSSEPFTNYSPKTSGMSRSLVMPGTVTTNETQQAGGLYILEQATVNLTCNLKIARKVLFAFSEFHSSIKRLTGFCIDRKVAARTISLLHNSKSDIDALVENMENAEDQNEEADDLLNTVRSCVHSFQQILLFLMENFSYYVSRIDVCFIRMVYLSIFGAFNELQNAHKLLNPIAKPPSFKSQGITADIRAKLLAASQISDLPGESIKDGPNNHLFSQMAENNLSVDEADERLYESVHVAVANAQVVFNELTKAINKSAVASTNNGPQVMNTTVASKFKDLTNTCMLLMEITKRLSAKLTNIRSIHGLQSKKLFWDDINAFLKAIIQTFSSVKLIMKDAPILNEVRQSMANLTKATKELTILLEASSYSNLSESTQASSFAWSSSHTNLSHFGTLSAPVRTPLVATVGAAAAQAIMPGNDGSSSSFFPSMTGDHPNGNSGMTIDQSNFFTNAE